MTFRHPPLPPNTFTLTPRHGEACPAPSGPWKPGPLGGAVLIFQEKLFIANPPSQEQHRQGFPTCLKEEDSGRLLAIARPKRPIHNIPIGRSEGHISLYLCFPRYFPLLPASGLHGIDSPALPLPAPGGTSLNAHKHRNSTSSGNWHTRGTEGFHCTHRITLSRECLSLTGKELAEATVVWECCYGRQGCPSLDSQAMWSPGITSFLLAGLKKGAPPIRQFRPGEMAQRL